MVTYDRVIWERMEKLQIGQTVGEDA